MSRPPTTSAGAAGSIAQVSAGVTRAVLAALSAVDAAETFTATGNGTTVTLAAFPARSYVCAVKATGAVTSWTVVVEVSLDDTNWTTVVTHDNTTPGDGVMLASTSDMPGVYMRARCSALTLGGGTNVVATFRAIS